MREMRLWSPVQHGGAGEVDALAWSRLAVASVRFHSLLQWTLKLLARRSIRRLRVGVVCFMVASCVERVQCDDACVVVTGAA
jgi:hypothetical protein